MNTQAVNITLTDFISQLNSNAEKVSFEQVIQVINENYNYIPATFTNGDLLN